MDIQSILINTYNPNPALRHEAESNLEAFLSSPGALGSLLGLAADQAHHRNLRQASSLVVKNKIREFFQADSPLLLADGDKDAVKHVILQTLWVEVDASIRGIFGEAVKIVSEFEYPEKWPTLVPEILANVRSGDIMRMYNALFALRKIVKRLEFKHKEGRAVLNELIGMTFPTIQELMKTVLENNTIEGAMVLKVCLKIFWSCTNYDLPTVSNVDVNLWFQMLSYLLNKPLPEASAGGEPAGQPLSIEEREAWPWWKVKKWAARIVAHFMARYGNPKYSSSTNQAFSEYFKNNTSKLLLAPVMNTLALRPNGAFVTDNVFRNCISYLSGASEMSPSYKAMKPHMDFILMKVIFPALCLTDNEVEMFETDPVEFVRRVHAAMEDWVDVRLAATALLQNLGRYRLKDTLPKLLPFIQGILNEHAQGVAAGQTVDYRRKDGCLVALSALSSILLEKPAYAGHMEPLILQHVLPEFSSPVAFMRCRVCLFMESFHEVKWSNEATVQGILTGLLTCLRDPCLPVQTAAAISLRLYLTEASARPLVIPILPDITREYFRIMSEVENDVVLSALQTIVLEFGDEIAGISTMLVSELLGAFGYYAAQGQDDDEAAFSAAQCLDTVSAVLEATKDRPEQINEIEAMLLPLINKLFAEECVEYVENICDIMGYLSYYNSAVSPALLAMAGPILDVLQSWAADYIVEFSPTIFNFLAQNPAQFLSGTFGPQRYIDMLCKVIERNMKETSTREVKAAAALTTCLIECCHGLIDPLIPSFLNLMFEAIKGTGSNSTQIKLLEISMAMIHYNTPLLLSILAANPAAGEALFNMLFAKLPEMEETSTQRLIVVSFCSLLSVPSSSLPPVVRNNLQSVFTQIIRELVMIQEEEANGKDGSDGSDDGSDDDDMDDDAEDGEEEEEDKREGLKRIAALHIPEDGYDEDDDCVNAEDEEYLKILAEMDGDSKARRRVYRDGELVDGEDDDSDDDDYDGATYTSPVDAMDVGLHFRQVLAAASQREPQVFVELKRALTAEDKERLSELLA